MVRSGSPQNVVYSYDLDDEQYKNVMNEWNCYEHLVWVNIVYYLALHIMALYGFYLCFTDASWYTVLFAIFLYNASIFGITAGVHRLWAHRTYKANLPFRIILIILETIAYQNSVYEWVRDHRVHHKHTESDADPVNSNRGLFFAHCGWLMCQKHPEVSRLGHKIDLSDLLTDQVVMFQKRHYVKLVIALCVVMPTIVPWRFWSENMWTAFFVCVTFRYVWGLNAAWLVNSAAHRFGYRPYDVNIEPADNLGVSVFTLGEGYHNYHHVFPKDYRGNEMDWFVNWTTFVLDLFAQIGWVYDRNVVSKEAVYARKSRTGPGANEYTGDKVGEY